jgi:hypothetical protein
MKLRLGPMPDTSVVKMTVSIPAPLKAQLDRYAQVHSQAFGAAADAQTLIPLVLDAWLLKNREFQRMLRGGSGQLSDRDRTA